MNKEIKQLKDAAEEMRDVVQELVDAGFGLAEDEALLAEMNAALTAVEISNVKSEDHERVARNEERIQGLVVINDQSEFDVRGVRLAKQIIEEGFSKEDAVEYLMLRVKHDVQIACLQEKSEAEPTTKMLVFKTKKLRDNPSARVFSHVLISKFNLEEMVIVEGTYNECIASVSDSAPGRIIYSREGSHKYIKAEDLPKKYQEQFKRQSKGFKNI